MINPTEKLKEIKSRIINSDVTHLDHIREMKGKTIQDIFHFRNQSIPGLIFVTTDKCLYVESVYENFDSEDEERDYLRSVITKHRFLYMVLEGVIDSTCLVRVGVINIDALNEYRSYKRDQEKDDREKYAKEQEYKRYLELKEKYEEDKHE